jgi:predicted deacylase
MSKGPLVDSLALFGSGIRRTFVDKGQVLDLVPPPYMRPIDDEIQSMLELEQEFPGLVKSEVIGHSVEGRAIVALHLSNFADERAKPTVGLMGNLHGDEIGNGPWGMAVLRQVLEGYGKDPAATAALNARDIRAIPYANPDGRFRVEQGYLTGDHKDLFHRANANGVDLNRNFPFGYGSTRANRGTAGPHALSEPESQAIAAYWTQHPPELYIDIHSAGDDVLVPYGFPHAPSPHLAGLLRIARGIGERNGYGVASSADFTNGGTSGTSKDWVHGVLGKPAFTMEVARTHHLTQQAFEDSVKRNRLSMSYALRIADDPYERSKGPAVAQARLDARGGIRVTAQPDGLQHAVAGVEVFRDPTTAPGTGIALRATGTRDAKLAGSTRWSLPPSAAGAATDGIDGVGQLYSRAKDTRGNWGPFSVVA